MMFLKEGRKIEEIVVHRTEDEEQDHAQGIRCPHCRWRPSASDRWQCECAFTPEPPFNSCGTSWNTFETRGRCPGCGARRATNQLLAENENCPGCDAPYCACCGRCAACGEVRIFDVGPCACGFPMDPERVAQVERTFGLSSPS